MMWAKVAVAGVMAGGGYAKKSLSLSGAAAAFIVGSLTFCASTLCGAALILFFLVGSAATRLGKKRKRDIEGESFQAGGRRNHVQVFSNSPATVLLVVLLLMPESTAQRWEAALVGAYLAQMAAMVGDTLSSEIGVLATTEPRLITDPFRTVPAGTNGGVSALGLAAAAFGGLGFGLLLGRPLELFALSLFGSVVDSLLGATLQYSGLDEARQVIVEHPGAGITHISGRAILDNHQVNLVTSILIMAAGGLIHWPQ